MLRHISCRVYAMAFTSANEGLAGFFDDLVRCETRLYNAIGEKLRAEHGIVASQFEFLRYLRDHPRSRVADVAATFAAGIGAISKMTDRLEARGWAARLPNPADRRSSLISLTASGAALVAEAERTFNDLLDELIAPAISADQVEAAGVTLAALRRALEHARVGVPVG
jgi:DNA-binding MarR family transcriptional regulator